jgi:5-methyltetrahydrofolate--homocysteine methyltransferase
VEVFTSEGADGLGANCSVSSDKLIGLAPQLRSLTDLPLLFQPNAGSPEMENGIAVYRQTPEEFADDIEKILDAGINAVGGCCGTNPDFIRAVRRRLDARG